jgi:branched-chain amino acid transport system permease protein
VAFFADAVVQGLVIGSLYAVITFGLAMVHSVSGVLNFAHGNFVVLAMYLCAALHATLGLDPYLAGLIVVPVMFGLGVLLYVVVFSRLTGASVITAIQATLGLVFVIQAGLLMVAGGQFQRVPSVLDDRTVGIAGVRIAGGETVAFVATVLLTAALFWVLDRSAFGRQVRAVQQNPRAARLVGVDVGRVRLMAFGIGIALAAVAGVLLTPGTSLHPSQGLTYTVVAVMAFFIGGMGNFLGTLLGALAIGLAESLGAVYLPGSVGFALPFVIVILVILLRPGGLVGRRAFA